MSEAGTLAEMPFGNEVEILRLEPLRGHDTSRARLGLGQSEGGWRCGRIWYLADGGCSTALHASGGACRRRHVPYCD